MAISGRRRAGKDLKDRATARSGSPYEERYGFSRGVRIGRRIEIAGTAPVPVEGEPVAEAAYAQMLRCGEIAIAALEQLGGTVADIVRTRMFITDPADSDEIGRAHREVFGGVAPAATMVVVAALLDSDWKVEIEVEAEIAEPG
jgi:enamine deaminase RidA (YjgF/YER057c/UK114 family)